MIPEALSAWVWLAFFNPGHTLVCLSVRRSFILKKRFDK
jgi:hypothetical protein